jgi:hypothetical protein
MKSDKKHFLLIDEIKMPSKKKGEAENRKTQTLLQATVTPSGPTSSFLSFPFPFLSSCSFFGFSEPTS